MTIVSEMKENKPRLRYLGLDVARGFAIIFMVFFHATYDIHNFGIAPYLTYKVSLFPKDYWFYFPKFVGSLFFSLVGMSALIKYRSRPNPRYSSFARKGAEVAFFALCITAVTAIAEPEKIVLFGTLHSIAAAMFMVFPFLRVPRLSLLLGFVLAVAGFTIQRTTYSFGWLFWLGFEPSTGKIGSDWFPILPWFGIVLIGVGLGHFYHRRLVQKHLADTPHSSHSRPLNALAWLGRYSLWIYLIHQPILIGLLILTKQIELY
jgi:uncharacterized membrane protein